MNRLLLLCALGLWFAGALGAEAQRDPVPEFDRISDTAARKHAFVEFMLPLIRTANDEIWKERVLVLELKKRFAVSQLDEKEQERAIQLGGRYGIPRPIRLDAHYFGVLLKRIDTIPAALALAQAANESGWGTSRFALDASNFFGIWCYEEGCGIKPDRRAPGARHEVRRFASVLDGVRQYMLAVNSGAPFADLHRIRARIRASGGDPAAIDLASGLAGYSQRKREYVREIERIIRDNQLQDHTIHRQLPPHVSTE